MAKFISFEGIDGTGKTTQIELIKKWLAENNYKVLVRSYPVYESYFGKEIGKHLSGKHKTVIDPKSMALWYAMDRWNDYKENKNAIESHDIILLNRYTLSSMVYQVLRDDNSKELAEWIENLEHNILSLPRPDLYLILDLTFELAYKNNIIKGRREYIDSEIDKYERDEKLQSNARKLYKELGTSLTSGRIIECFKKDKMLTIDEIFQKLKREIEKIL